MRNLMCRLFGHRYKHKRRITRSVHELTCARCKREFAINTDAKTVLPMDFELRELHRFLLEPSKPPNSNE